MMPQTTPITISAFGQDTFTAVDAALLDDGSFVVSWEGRAYNGTTIVSQGVYAQRFGSDGQAMGSPTALQIETGTPVSGQTGNYFAGSGRGVSVAATPNGTLVAYLSAPDSVAAANQIHVQLLNTALAPTQPVFTISASGQDTFTDVDAALLDDGSFVVSWEGRAYNGSTIVSQGVYAQRFGSDGQAMGSPTALQIETGTPVSGQTGNYFAGSGRGVSVAATPNGTLVAYLSAPDSVAAANQIHVQLLNTALAPTQPVFTISASGQDTFTDVDAALLDDGSFVVSWEGRAYNGTTIVSQGVYAQRFGSDGQAIGSPTSLQIETGTPISGQTGNYFAGSGRGVSVAATSNGTLVAYLSAPDSIAAANQLQISIISTALFTSNQDIVNFNSLTPSQLVVTGSGGDLYNAQEGNDTVILPTDSLKSVSGFDKTKSFDAGPGNDSVTALDGTNTIYGGYGSDTLTGGSGSNYLYAGIKSSAGLGFITPDDSDNTLIGGSGFNFLDAWTNRPNSHDVLIGGSGSNYFYVQGNDEVQNFGAKDQINVISVGRADQVNVLSDPTSGITLVTIFEQNGSSYRTARVTIDSAINPETIGVKAASVGGTSVVTITQTGYQTSDAAMLTQDFITSANNTIGFLRPLARAYYGYALGTYFLDPIVKSSVSAFTNYLLTAYAGTAGAAALQKALASPAVSNLFNKALVKILGDAVKGQTIGSAPSGDPTGLSSNAQWLSLALKVSAAAALGVNAPLVVAGGIALTIGPAIIQAGFALAFQSLEAETQKLLDQTPSLRTFKFENNGSTTSIESPASSSARADTYAFTVDDASGSYVIDPSGASSYILASNAGSPALTSVVLPALPDVGTYQISIWTGTFWGGSQTVAPGQLVALPAGTSAVKVSSYDAGGSLIASEDPMLFTVTFASAGMFSGSVAVSPQTVGVYRFFDTTDGTHFLTASSSERDTVLNTRPDLVYEGVGLRALDDAGNDPAIESVYRFFDTVHGTHFFTASLSERDAVIAGRADLTYEPNSTFFEHTSQQPGDTPVYRFFDLKFGTHFYTSDAGERSTILATRSDLVAEGVGFYAPSPVIG